MRHYVSIIDPDTGQLVQVPVIMGAAHGTADQVSTNWANKLGAAGERISQGVDAVRVAPGQAAARQKAVWLANLQASGDRWASRVAAVSLTDWQSSMKEKGITRIGAGATAAIPKMTAFLNKFLPYVDNAKASLPARGNYEQNKARMNQFIDKVHQFKA